MRIKRTKTGQGGPDDLPPTTAVHWAKAVDRRGCVVAWTPNEAEAADLDPAVSQKVMQHYATRPAAGTLEFLGAPASFLPDLQPFPSPASEPPGDPDEESDLHALLAENDRLRQEITRQLAEIEGLRRDLDAATAPPSGDPGYTRPVPAITPFKRGPGRPPKPKVTEETPEEKPSDEGHVSPET